MPDTPKDFVICDFDHKLGTGQTLGDGRLQVVRSYVEPYLSSGQIFRDRRALAKYVDHWFWGVLKLKTLF